MAYLSQPPPFLQSAGVPTVPWKQWISVFETYLLASGGEEYSAERKRAMLLHCIGVEGQRIFQTLPKLPDSVKLDTYQGAVKVLEDYFIPSVNVVAERYRFRQRAQKTGETIDCYVASLRELSKTCDFGPMTDEMIRDQIIEKTATPRVRERLLMEKDLKLNGAIETAKCIENAMKEAKAIGNSLTKETLEQDVYRLTSRGNKPNVTKTGTKTKRVCYRCGSTQHIASDPNCKARDKKCRNCKKIGHFAVMCRSKPIAQTKNYVREVTTQNSTGPPAYHIPSNPGDGNYEVLANDSNGRKGSKSKRIRCVVMINGVPIQLDVDTGSGVSILSEEVFSKSFLSEALVKVPEGIKLSSYTKHKIEVIGCFEATVSYLDRVANTIFFVVKSGSNLLGRDLIQKLGINILGSQLSCFALSEDSSSNNPVIQGNFVLPNYIKSFQSMFSDTTILPTIKGMIHKVHVDKSVKPKHQKLRRLPFGVRKLVSQELSRLESMGVIEKIDSSEWVSPIVVSYKKSGNVRICVDLRQVNKAVIPDSFPLPKIDELLGELRNAKLFSQLDLAAAYHQLLLHPDSRPLTAFITHDGLFQYKRVCFGLSSAPSVFQKMMQSMLAGLSGVQCYLDDVIVYGKDEEHNENLREVLTRLDSYGVKLNDKCKFNQSSIKFLGHIISSEGIRVDAVTSIMHSLMPQYLRIQNPFVHFWV
ncbi:hypothetical protein HOLleu_21220 [Holothuria leucospilota]|uniref:Reverse transcriptase domain-containing protein n=1 Tax=Holothuria leucospilota TaxID=206669 RepID=A0A9Q1BXE2_HOLLE|nr:hypothetical protein HOLleu_21220 [Holothuria leucospilota]